MKRYYLSLLAVLVILCLSGCSRKNEPANLVQSSKFGSAQLEIKPFPPHVMQKAKLRLSITDMNGQPVPGLHILFDLTMPGMVMPTNQPQAEEVEPGVYQALTVFTMEGAWQIEARCSDGLTVDSIVFQFEIP